MNKTQSLIDNYFDQLTIFIDNLPLKDEGKSYLWYYCYLNFYSTPQISEDGNTTIGIKTIAQLENFRALLKNNLEKVRNKAIINWTDSLNKIDPTTAITKIQESQYKIRQKEFLEEIGGEKINDWDIWFKDFLDNELNHQLNRRKLEKDLGEKQPERSFPDYLKHKEPEKFASLIKKEFPGIKGRDSAALYQALKSLKLIETTSKLTIFNAMNKYFGGIGNYSGFTTYLNESTSNFENLEESGRIDEFIDILKNLKLAAISNN